jgi:hypothetical protein
MGDGELEAWIASTAGRIDRDIDFLDAALDERERRVRDMAFNPPRPRRRAPCEAKPLRGLSHANWDTALFETWEARKARLALERRAVAGAA